ncbi:MULTISPECIES: hypothetical protein [Paenibacillus]|uniref:Uncharacterized protein n=1 Tax=Paenibacillus amylolyticus TaxID=1451 RepID=A0ABD8B2L6_PAEAM|nr:hypothetical protein [Paenibacillus sp. GM1FR]PJN59378.1 hypothetical protein PAEAM_30090 [Paenibacillus sp. GM1FR]
MRKTLLTLTGFIFLLLMTATPMYAAPTSYDSLPKPDWVVTHDEVSNFGKIKDYLYLMDSSGKVTVYQEKTKTKIGSVDVISSSWVQYSGGFEYKNQILSNGNMSFITSYKDKKKNREFPQLRIFSPKGNKLLDYTFTEKTTNEVGSYIMDDGTLLVYLKLNSSKYMTYRYSVNGKLLSKKMINEFMYYQQNGYISTISNWSFAGEYKSTLSFYDDQLRKEFSYRNNGLSFRGILKDKTMIFTKFDQAGSTAVIAKNPQGKTLWTKTISESADFLIGNTKNSSNSFMLQSISSIYAFNSKGFVTKSKVSTTGSFWIRESADDKTLLVEKQDGLLILDRRTLKTITSYKIDTSDKQFNYAGNRVVYIVDPLTSNVSKYTL